jgi:hypothetical protein
MLRMLLSSDAAASAEIPLLDKRNAERETNGKVERFNRALLEEWAYVRRNLRDLRH